MEEEARVVTKPLGGRVSYFGFWSSLVAQYRLEGGWG